MSAGARTDLDVRGAIEAVLRRWPVVLGITALLIAVTLGLTMTQPTLYQGSAKVLIQPDGTKSLFNEGGGNSLDPELVVATEIQILQSETVRQAVRRQHGPVRKVGAGRVGETLVIAVRARDAEPARAAQLSNAYARAYIDVRREQAVDDLADAGAALQEKVQEYAAELAEIDRQLDAAPDRQAAELRLRSRRDQLIAQQSVFEQRLDELQVQSALKSGGALLIAPSTVPEDPVQPTPIRNGVAALVAGLVLGVAAAALLEYLNDTIVSKEDLEEAAPGLPVIGLLPFVRRTWEGPHVAAAGIADSGSASAEAYRSLRTNVQLLVSDRDARVIQVTSPRAGEGKTTTAAGLAVVLAKAGQRVLLIDADLRRGRVHKVFGAAPGRGLAGVLADDIPPEIGIQRVPGDDDVSIVAAGPPPSNPSELLASRELRRALAEYRGRFDITLIDSAPVLPVTDAAVIAPWVDATIVVAASGITSRRDLESAVESLSRVGAPIVGTVLNRVSEREGYGYRYEYRADNVGNGAATSRDVPARTAESL